MPDTVLSLQREIDSLGPWCHEIEIAQGISTRDWFERHPESDLPFLDPQGTVVGRAAQRLFSGVLKDRSVLDCGCNAGGYSFLAREAGAGRCFGFDARQHWIDQARFIARRRKYEEMTFEVRDLYDLVVEPFDVTFFNGLLYHLPDPIRGLKIAADLTRELIFVDTATRDGMPDGYLAVENESKESPVSGVYGLNWLPTGPDVLCRMLQWVGFVECQTIGRRPIGPQEGRLGMIASKTPGLLPLSL